MASSSPKNDSDTDAILPQKDREAKLRKKKAKIKQHGRGLGQMYKDAVEKRRKDSV